MTEMQLRSLVVDTFMKYEGCKKGTPQHRELIDIYNSQSTLPAGYKMAYSDSWCAATVSAIGIKLGLSQYILPECSCGRMIELYKKINRWQEKDNYTPQIGDLIMYDWQDPVSQTVDNTGAPDHVGMVISVAGTKFTVLEGNKGTESICGIRVMNVNGRYIRGFCLPNYGAAARTYKSSAIIASPIKTCKVELPVVELNSKGEAVKTLQILLQYKGYNVKGVDGDFGKNTKEALLKFQNDHKLLSDGICGSNTWSALIG